jgi:hypothetical protein
MCQEMIDKLKKDLGKLIEKHSQFIDKNDFGSALNVMKNIDIITNQLRRMDYETMISKYKTVDNTGKEVEELAIWKQNSFGQIKDHKIYRIIPTEPILTGSVNVKTVFSEDTINDIARRVTEIITK